MYRGLTPKLAGTLISMVFSDKIADRLGFPQTTEVDDIDMDDEQM